ncbi:Eco57I restriction endonuclease [Candidatus Saccharibacteria bacterium RAAC3_TM7_1]|nr:Eco57I restriction endonuclease [Candidatus Saccharibacteria bacterium RAAC3_TM7_1]HCZ28216.1 restriction endonuclease [Candidatus Saccharibacteria bacterium]
MANFDDSKIKEIITGRVEPHIYSFQTNTLPNLLKVGDSYRSVEERLNEWRRHYKDLVEVSRHKALVNDNVFFRDHSVHKYLETNGTARVEIDRENGIYSNEFFDSINGEDVTVAVQDVIDSYGTPGKYAYYDSLRDRVELHYAREKDFAPRDNQQEVINNFSNAVSNGRTNLLMYAVMRFGKSITSMWCAKEIDSKLTLVVSAKADVRSEWKQTVESHKDFAGYRFMEISDLATDLKFSDVYGAEFYTGDGKQETCTNVVLFLTLQDLAGSAVEVKKRHEILKTVSPDLLVIDETHFGARAQVLGKILAGVELSEEDEESLKDTDGIDELGRIQGLQPINAKIKLHLSGTPYRILMGSEFAKEDIIAFVQFSDIYEAKLDWSANNLDKNEWNNPYYGFPQMVRFAFNPNESSRKKLEAIPGSKPSEIFAPVDTNKGGNYETFAHEQEAVDLLQVLDGSKEDSQLLGLLDHPSVKSGKLTRHVVIVLPKRASCDAFEKLIRERADLFKNLSQHKVLNISGHNASLTKPEQIKTAIAEAEENGEKTLTLTVNKMLTGTTVPQWDTMIYLKATVSPQEYDQAIFRLQSPWIKQYTSETGEVIKYDMKPQTLLVDLDPTRLFFLQEAKALSYGANTGNIGNENIEQFVARELRVSPVLAFNAENNKLVEVEASVIIDAVRKYASERSISEDVNEIGVDISLRDNEDIYGLISTLAEINGKNGLNISPIDDEGDGQELDADDDEDRQGSEETDGSSSGGTDGSSTDDEASAIKTFEKQFRMYYVLILLFAFLSTTEEKSLTDVVANLNANEDNRRIARSLGLKKEHLNALRQTINWSVLSSLDYKIQNSDYRANDDTVTPVEHINTAINKFGKLSDSEVFTPAHIVDKVYDSFDDAFWQNISSAKVLDVASKSGSFANGFVARAMQSGAALDEVRNHFYSIPTSPAAYEFTRKMYEALGLNIDNIAQHFTSYDTLELKHPDAITKLLENKTLSEITKQDLKGIDDKIESNESEVSQVKFSAIVGNPPYDQQSSGAATDKKPIYHLFFESAKAMNPSYVSLIHPARFLFNAGKTPKDWNKKMLNDKHFSVPFYEPSSKKVFKEVDIKGGVAITLWNRDNPSGGLGGSFVSYEELRTTLAKVGKGGLNGIISTAGGSPTIRYEDKFGRKRSYFRTSAFFDLPDVFSDKKDATHQIEIVGLERGNKRSRRFVSASMLNDKAIEKWKVFVPESNGTGAIGEIMSTPLVGEPLVGCTESFIRIGAFDTEPEARNCMKYVKTKFCRAMLGTLKITQHNPRSTWCNVPVQDFTSESDIDWSQSLANIDKQLYIKYGLDESEINFIETRVRAME